MASPEYTQGAGTPTQLPKGEASRLNESTTVTPAQDPVLPPPVTQPEAPPVNYKPGDSDTEQILFGDVQPGERSLRNPELPTIPSSVIRRLSLLRDAAAQPGAPASLKAIYTAIVNRLESDLRA